MRIFNMDILLAVAITAAIFNAIGDWRVYREKSKGMDREVEQLEKSVENLREILDKYLPKEE